MIPPTNSHKMKPRKIKKKFIVTIEYTAESNNSIWGMTGSDVKLAIMEHMPYCKVKVNCVESNQS